jgi:hypothetical protein
MFGAIDTMEADLDPAIAGGQKDYRIAVRNAYYFAAQDRCAGGHKEDGREACEADRAQGTTTEAPTTPRGRTGPYGKTHGVAVSPEGAPTPEEDGAVAIHGSILS